MNFPLISDSVRGYYSNIDSGVLPSLCFTLGNAPEFAPAVMVKCGPAPPWIEVYHDGELTSEWQPKDGEIYRFLVNLLEDDLYAPVLIERLEYAPMLAEAF